MRVIVYFGFPGNSDFLFILCLLYAGESQQYPIRQVEVPAVEGLTPKER